MCYSIQPKDKMFVNGYGFFSFGKKMGKDISKNISKKLICKYTQKLLDHATQVATEALKTTSKIVIQETAEGTGDLIGNKIE